METFKWETILFKVCKSNLTIVEGMSQDNKWELLTPGLMSGDLTSLPAQLPDTKDITQRNPS